MKPDEIREFQDGHHDWEGKPLAVDGVLGPRTRWALAISRLDPRRQAIVARACSKIGVRETVANRGEWPDFVLRRCGIYVPDDPTIPMPHNAWCAAHASWCMSVEGLSERKEAGARELATSLRPTTVILPGDFGWYPTGTWQAHIFPIISTGPGEVLCADGNFRNQCALWRRLTSQIRIVTPFPREDGPELPPGMPLVEVQRGSTR